MNTLGAALWWALDHLPQVIAGWAVLAVGVATLIALGIQHGERQARAEREALARGVRRCGICDSPQPGPGRLAGHMLDEHPGECPRWDDVTSDRGTRG